MPVRKIGPRKSPCASCPYRRDVPSGVWAATEYDKLTGYDLPTGEQPQGVFMCHQGGGEVCAGWAAVHGNRENLALRLAPAADRDIDVPAVLDYESPVPLFSSSAEAAEHGKRDVEEPDAEALSAVRKIAQVRAIRGRPVTYKGRPVTDKEPGDIPPPDPANPETRLLRSIYGLCPVCDHGREAHYGDDYVEHQCRECEKEENQ